MADRPKRRTKDWAERAADIADREAEKACQEERDCNFFSTWLKAFETALKEFSWVETATE